MTSQKQWVQKVTDDAPELQVSKAAGIAHSTYVRQTQGESLTVENMLRIARAFGASVPDALVAHGIVTADELATVSLTGTLADATDQQLLDEIASRLEHVAEGESEVFDSIPAHDDATVHYPDFTPVEDEQAVASERSDDNGEDTNYDD